MSYVYMYRRATCLIFFIYFAFFIDGQKENSIASVVHKSLKSVARSCMQAVNASESDLQYLRKDPPYPEKAACIMSCLLKKLGVIKDDQFSKTGFLTVVQPLVFHNKKKLEHFKEVAEYCDKEIPNKDETCQLSNGVISCIFKHAPELHFRG